jgi:tetratricopeptide (TPR) repeat protein/tRNA A-37 threonylcarbamoyl transferase component Bud32
MNRLGPYELGEEFARGAMGVVYHARDPYLGRSLAIKVIRDEALQDEESQARFRREALALARLRHPGVVGVHSAGVTPQGYPYLVMDLLRGGALSRRLSGATLPLREAIRLTRELSEALGYAHAQGVLHRDVKPANVLLDAEGHAVLTDFGLAKVIGARRLTQTGDILGTPSYMAPEQIEGEGGLGPATDVYALGATLFHMLTGRPPLVAGTLTELFLQVKEQTPPAASSLAPAVDPGLDRILSRCLAKDPGDRYSTMAALRADLDLWEAASEGSPEPEEPVRAVSAPKPWLAVAGIALGLLLGFGGGLASAAPLDRANRSWRSPSELGPTLEATWARGEARLSREDYEGAIADFLLVTKVEPSCDAAWRGLGQARLASGEEEQGLEALKRAVELDPNNASAWSSRGKALYSRGDFREAAEAYQRAAGARPRSASLQNSLAFCLQRAGQEEAAHEAWERGRKLDPRSGESALFECLFGKAPLAERLEALGKAAVLDPGEEDLLVRRARVFLEAERYPEAVAGYSLALKRLLRRPDVLLGRGQALVLRGRERDGFADIELIRELYPENPEIRSTRGRVFYRIGRYREALLDFEYLQREHPSYYRQVEPLADSIRAAKEAGSYRVVDTVVLKETKLSMKGTPVLVGKRLTVIRHDGEWAEVELDVRGTRAHGYVYYPNLRLAVEHE